MKINRYKFCDGVTEEIKGILQSLGFHPGSWKRKDDHDWMSIWRPLYDSIEVHVDFDLTTKQWDDFENVLVFDDDFGQPYTPFYSYWNGEIQEFPVLEAVVREYNRFMDSLVAKGILDSVYCQDNQTKENNVALHIVSVKHRPGQQKNFWFEVPEKLVPLISRGSTVLCSTRRGQQLGIAQTGILTGDGVERLAELEGAKFPLSKIVGVRQEIPMDGIKVGKWLSSNRPSKTKMIRRLKEFYDHRAFRTRVAIDSEGWLLDGYSAYLVAKMFDLKYIPVEILA